MTISPMRRLAVAEHDLKADRNTFAGAEPTTNVGAYHCQMVPEKA